MERVWRVALFLTVVGVVAGAALWLLYVLGGFGSPFRDVVVLGFAALSMGGAVRRWWRRRRDAHPAG